jgi:hypothetical protein
MRILQREEVRIKPMERISGEIIAGVPTGTSGSHGFSRTSISNITATISNALNSPQPSQPKGELCPHEFPAVCLLFREDAAGIMIVVGWFLDRGLCGALGGA